METTFQVSNMTEGVTVTVGLFGFFVYSSAITIWWSQLMGDAGFTDWDAFPGISQASTSFMVGIMTVWITDFLIEQWDVSFNRITAKSVAMSIMLATAAVLSWAAFLNTWSLGACPEASLANNLIHQVDAVTKLNCNYCLAWCHGSAPGMAMEARGLCDVSASHNGTARWMTVVASLPVQTWCTEALEHQTFTLLSEYHGFSPFAALRDEASGCLVSSSGAYMTLWWLLLVNAVAGVGLLIPAALLLEKWCC